MYMRNIFLSTCTALMCRETSLLSNAWKGEGLFGSAGKPFQVKWVGEGPVWMYMKNLSGCKGGAVLDVWGKSCGWVDLTGKGRGSGCIQVCRR